MCESLRIISVLKTGGEYGEHHVINLKSMCDRWLPKHEFICLTDAPSTRFECRSLKHNLPGWWSKMELFEQFREGSNLFFDLDTIIRGVVSLGCLDRASFLILRDFYRGRTNPLAMGSGVMFWRGDFSWIWESFIRTGRVGFRGDQDFLERAFSDAGQSASYFQDVTDQICSFKAGGGRDDAPIVAFHGKPRPWEQSLIPYPSI